MRWTLLITDEVTGEEVLFLDRVSWERVIGKVEEFTNSLRQYMVREDSGPPTHRMLGVEGQRPGQLKSVYTLEWKVV